MISIDQNCHSLWDALPKLQALARAGRRVRHFVEDIDVAFTELGAAVEDGRLHLARERFHRSGGQDWGAALFYCEFLGRLPAEIRDWEPLTGMKTKSLAKELGRSVDDLYDEFSPADNWQLIGPSYVGDREHHRVIGDLSVARTGEFLRQVVRKARADCERAFPGAASRRRVADWFAAEEALLARLLSEYAGAGLADLYEGWLREYLGESFPIGRTSSLFALVPDAPGTALLELFLRDYERLAAIYNEAVRDSGAGLHPLETTGGELPFFATLPHQGHMVRAAVSIQGDEIRIGRRAFALGPGRRVPVESLAAAGIRCLAGKAVILVIQVRLGPNGAPLVLPYRGSLYMPAAHRLSKALSAAGLLHGDLKPVVRVRFRLLDRMRSLDTTVHLPDHLVPYFGRSEIPARELGQNHAAIASAAAGRLRAFRDDALRQQWQRQAFPQLLEEIDRLDARRRELARTEPKGSEIREVWKRMRSLKVEVLEGTVRQIARDTQAADLDYWDSRGALLPWCVALGGETFYNHVLENAEVHEEVG